MLFKAESGEPFERRIEGEALVPAASLSSIVGRRGDARASSVSVKKRASATPEERSGIAIYRNAYPTKGTKTKCKEWVVRLGKRFTHAGVILKRFYSHEEARDWAAAEIEKRRAHGRQAYTLDPSQYATAHRVIELWGDRPLEALESLVRDIVKDGAGLLVSKTVSETCDAFVSAKSNAGFSWKYLRELKQTIRIFARVYGARSIRSVSTLELQSWLDSQRVSPNSRRHYFTDLRTIFSWAMKQGWLTQNPWHGVERPKKTPHKIEVFSASETFRLLEHARKVRPGILPVLLCGLFAGLRREEIARLDWSSFRLTGESPCIVLDAKVAKTNARRVVRLEGNALSWFKLVARETGPVAGSSDGWRLQALANEAGVSKWPRNAMRHSFASYMAAIRGEVYTAEQLGHSGLKMIKQHYQALVSSEEAQLYWSISP